MMNKKRKIAVPSEEEVAKYAPTREPEASADARQADPQAQATSTDGQVAGNDIQPEPQRAEETMESLRTQVEEYKDRLLRAQAECANVSKRLHQQHAASLRLAGMDIARALLPVADNFERTLQNLDERAADDPVAQGVKLIADQLNKVLRDHGVEPIEAVGRPFDPMFHEAMMQDRDSDLPAGTVTSEMERGYRMRDRVLRPAKVTVAAGPDQREDEEQPQGERPIRPGAKHEAKGAAPGEDAARSNDVGS